MSTNLISFEQNQRRQTLNVIIWTTMVAAFTLGVFDITFRTWASVISLFSLALLCIPILFLNSKGNFTVSAVLLSAFVLIIISINLFDGDGVHDPGILAYPIFILVGTLIFGKRAAPIFAFAAVASLSMIVYLEFFKYIHPRIGSTTFDILIPTITLLLSSAAIIWVIVDNTEKDLKRVRESEVELRTNYDLTLEAWAKVMEYRDRETEGHSRRLAVLCTRLARALKVSEEEIVQLQRGALLHDIGKLAIPDEILLKPSSLDEDEKRIIEKHPVFAKQMLSGIPFLEPSICVAYSHHEYWNGQGYPDGLKGEEIPLLARIFAVVDAWDALRSERVYRPSWSVEDAVAYLKKNAGIIYDPHIIDAFLSLI
jgi:HD-GYP domain-containing protein (c-di-GMP phosphodiesterase class II)